ncbi:MAG: hypothetical protein VKN13_05685 [Cyanobacteriota bacterium]|nr:hypothetical protein [Cyanobacteriota bacterium]
MIGDYLETIVVHLMMKRSASLLGSVLSLMTATPLAWALSVARANVLPVNSRVCEGQAVPGPSCSFSSAPVPDWIFWVPTNFCAPPATQLVSSFPSRVITLFNNNPARTLWARATSAANIIVGSPGTRDVLQGNGGGDVYVVGNGTASLVTGRGAGDSVPVVVSTTPENDQVILSVDAFPDTVYISTSLEIIHGANWLNVGGPYSYASTCVAASPPARYDWLVNSFQSPLLASAATVDPIGFISAGLIGPPPKEDQDRVSDRFWLGRKFPDVCTVSTCFAGTPAIVGLQITGPQPDRLVLPPGDYFYNGKPLNDRSPLPIQVVNQISFANGGVHPSGCHPGQCLRRRGIGKKIVEGVPLVYFSENGLLVFSANSSPLGSIGNPGRVIAQLLDRSGRPLALPVSGQDSIDQATFVTVQSFPCQPAPLGSKAQRVKGWCSQLAPGR